MYNLKNTGFHELLTTFFYFLGLGKLFPFAAIFLLPRRYERYTLATRFKL